MSIARALLQDPDILILDEPTSNMDNNSELMFKRRLAIVMGDKTVLLITHRLSLLDLVDRLMVMDSGRVIADGPKQAVLAALRGEHAKTGTIPGMKSPSAAKPAAASPREPVILEG